MRKGLLLVSLITLCATIYFSKKSIVSDNEVSTPTPVFTSASAHATGITAPPMAAHPSPPPSQFITAKNSTLSTHKNSFDKPYEYFQKRLEFLNSCFKRRCKLANNDPKAYELAVFLEVENTLETLKQWQKRHQFMDARIPLLMKSFLSYEKAEIKVLALEVLATQSKDQRLVPHILRNVIEQAHPAPISLAMKELGRYQNSPWKSEIEKSVLEVLSHGSVFSAIEVAKNLKPVINSRNRPQFQSALDELTNQPLTEDIQAALQKSLAQ